MASSLSPGQLSSGRRPTSQVYVDLIHSYNNAGEYSTCFTELQRDFIVSRPTKLKSLIRLVKHWYQQVRPRGRGRPPAPRLGPGALSWEEAGRDPGLAERPERDFIAVGPWFAYR